MRAQLRPDLCFQLLRAEHLIPRHLMKGPAMYGLASQGPVSPCPLRCLHLIGQEGQVPPGPTLTFALRFRPVRVGGRFISRFLSPVRLQTPIFKAIEKVYAIKAVATFLLDPRLCLCPAASGRELAHPAAPAFHGPEPRHTHRPASDPPGLDLGPGSCLPTTAGSGVIKIYSG